MIADASDNEAEGEVAVDPDDLDEGIEVAPEVDEERSNPSRSTTRLLDRLLDPAAFSRGMRFRPMSSASTSLTSIARRGSALYFATCRPKDFPQHLASTHRARRSGSMGRSGPPGLCTRLWSATFTEPGVAAGEFECDVCHHAKTESHEEAERGGTWDCPACGSVGKFGPALNWLRPPGFADPYSVDEGTSPDDQPSSVATTCGVGGRRACGSIELGGDQRAHPLLLRAQLPSGLEYWAA